MKTRKRRGNIILAMVVLLVLVMTFLSLLSLNIAQKHNARNKAVSAGDTNSYIAMANVCGWAFKDDLEAQAMSIVVADVTNPGGTNIGIEIFDTVMEAFQQALQADPALAPADEWTHALTDPNDAIDFTGITDSKTEQHLQRILDNARVAVNVKTPLSIIGAEGDVIDVVDGAHVTIDDVRFEVELTKGTWRVTQLYRLSGETVVMRLDGPYALFTVDDTNAECTLEQQTVSRTNINR